MKNWKEMPETLLLVLREIMHFFLLLFCDFSNYIIATVGIEGTTSYSKVRIYMWLEGNDLDCVNQVSGTNITFDLHLTSVNLLGGN